MNERLGTGRRERSRGEEAANVISHGAGLVAGLVGGPFLIARMAGRNDPGMVVGASLFAATVVILYLVSTLYHALPGGKAKRLFRILDHSAIYLLIAGTYTPFTLGVLAGAWGWSLLGVIWGLAAAGVAFKVRFGTSLPVVSVGLYLLMGWLVLVAVYPLYLRIDPAGFLLLGAGGFAYTAGILFFAMESRLPYSHFIWHLFVLAGTSCHYLAVLWYAA